MDSKDPRVYRIIDLSVLDTRDSYDTPPRAANDSEMTGLYIFTRYILSVLHTLERKPECRRRVSFTIIRSERAKAASSIGYIHLSREVDRSSCDAASSILSSDGRRLPVCACVCTLRNRAGSPVRSLVRRGKKEKKREKKKTKQNAEIFTGPPPPPPPPVAIAGVKIIMRRYVGRATCSSDPTVYGGSFSVYASP